MQRLNVAAMLATLACVCGAGRLAAQDLAIDDVRVIAGNGTVIEHGSIVIRGGRIASVGAGAANAGGLTTIDGRGLSALPGFIDAHRHVNTGPNEQKEMQALLDAGYTTILSGGGPAEGNLTLRDHIDKGLIRGPRIIPSARIDLADSTPDKVRAQAQAIAKLGVQWIGELLLTPKPGPTPKEMENLRALLDEARKRNVRVQIHAVSPQAMMAAVDAGVKYLVHTPHFGWLPFDDAKRVAAAGVKQLSTIGFGVPVFGVFANDNKPRFRDGKPWPESILQGDGRGQEAGYKAVNARTSWDAGVIYGYGTDTNYDPKAGLAHELKSLNLMFSAQDIVKLMGPNTASYLEMENELGTLEAGKQADIVLVEGNPLEGYWNLLNTRLVLKGGVIVSDQRR
ncbi:MAG TPA: amidohydrolase family protein [Gammaproteobacteria bacterium]|jgi:imidazolonepropionase-like amidohydrolase|nr:amidohydrolase family protein [Gammaproteobacteria bacterium]